MNLGLENKVIIVTGGAKGIGYGIIQVLAKEGAIPFIIGRSKEDNEAAAAFVTKEGGKVYHTLAELNDPNQCKKAVEEVIKQAGRIDGLVNNAGQNDGIGLEHGSYEEFMVSLHRNLIHYYLIAHYALPELIKTKGPIVNITSKTSFTGQGGTSAYAAANGGRNALTREWAVELLKYGIRVNAVVVAESWTPLYEKWIKTLPDPEATLEKIISKIPLEKRMTTPEEIANAVVFLLSERSSHTTGEIVFVDGGYTHLDRALI